MARVLHIEDDANSRLLVRKLLNSSGHEVVDAASGVMGVRLASGQRFDLVLVDINIPDLDGYEVTLRLRGMTELKGVPIVAITAEGDRQTSLAVGADGFISKPIDVGQFPAIVDRFLCGYREAADHTGEIRLRERSQKIVERLERKVVELSEANARLSELAKLRSEFLRNMTHELATPLTPVVGYLGMLLGGELGVLTTQQQKCLVAVQQSTQRLRSLIETLLDVSALETGRLQLVDQDYDFGKVAAAALAEVAVRFSEADIRLTVEPLQTEWKGRGDAMKLQRAMVHLLDNAAKFTPKGGEVAIELRRDLSMDDSPWFCFVLADSGPGVPPDQMTKIMEPFYQVDGSVTRSYGGVGLGLAFARRVAEMFGGAIEVQSPPLEQVAGRSLSGTAFVLRVPARAPQSLR